MGSARSNGYEGPTWADVRSWLNMLSEAASAHATFTVEARPPLSRKGGFIVNLYLTKRLTDHWSKATHKITSEFPNQQHKTLPSLILWMVHELDGQLGREELERARQSRF